MAFVKAKPPNLEAAGRTLEEKLRALQEYLVALDKEINHALSNIDEENLSETLSATIKSVSDKIETLEGSKNGGNPGECGGVASVDGVLPDSDGNVPLGAVTSVNGNKADEHGNVDVKEGSDGVTFIPFISEEGELSWSNDGGLDNPASMNIKGAGVPTGGSVGQILTKKSTTDYDTEWQDAPEGGGASEVLSITAEEFEALTDAQKQELYASGIRVIAVEDGLDDPDKPLDADLLGGKAPQYYIQPYNLLDNSDFTNPVNQRGQTSYVDGMSIDRWGLNYFGGQGTFNVNNMSFDISGEYCELSQVVADSERLAGKTVTLAAKTTEGSIYSHTFIFGQYSEVAPSQDVRLYTLDTATVILRSFNSAVGFVWAALYVGEYTADTLPPYVPKGYVAELAACRYFYRKQDPGSYLVGICYYSGAITIIGLDRSPMHRAPDVSIERIASINQQTVYTPQSTYCDKSGLMWVSIAETISVGTYVYVWGVEESAEL